MVRLQCRYPRGGTSRCVHVRPAELLPQGGGWAFAVRARGGGVRGPGCWGSFQTQAEQSPRHACFHLHSLVVCLRRESIPEGDGDESFIAQRLAVDPAPVVFFRTTLKKLPRTSFP